MNEQSNAGSSLSGLEGPDRITPGDARYAELVGRGFNKRFSARPDYVQLVGTTEQVVHAVKDAVRHDQRVVVRSGGHCLEAFVDDPTVQAPIDASLMTGVSFDPAMGA